jgi:DNA-binding NarL/FixJ family response regulator
MPTLSPREKQTLQCLANGLSFKETACELGICVRTVYAYVSKARCKLGQANTVSTVATAVSLGLINADFNNSTNEGDSSILIEVKY